MKFSLEVFILSWTEFICCSFVDSWFEKIALYLPESSKLPKKFSWFGKLPSSPRVFKIIEEIFLIWKIALYLLESSKSPKKFSWFGKLHCISLNLQNHPRNFLHLENCLVSPRIFKIAEEIFLIWKTALYLLESSKSPKKFSWFGKLPCIS